MSPLDATDLSREKQDGNLSPVESLDDTLNRIETLDDQLNAVLTVTADRARKRARENPAGPFGGCPILLKDILGHQKGIRATYGSRLLEEFVPGRDHPLVTRFKEAGFIPVGRTNVAEFGLLPTTEPERFGPTRNPWDLSRSAGGSSGGAAAAVASGMVPVAHANDAGGSIRVPASCCGVFGLKPTRGRLFSSPRFGSPMQDLVQEHVITRTVRDSAGVLDAVKGTGGSAETSESFRKCLHSDPEPLSIAVLEDSPVNATVDSSCRRAVRQTADSCEKLGHQVKGLEAEFETSGLIEDFATVWTTGLSRVIDALASLVDRDPGPETLEELTWWVYREGQSTSAQEYLKAREKLDRFTTRLQGEVFEDIDLLLTPTLAEPPPEIGMLKQPSRTPKETFERTLRFNPFGPPFNVSGQPAVSIPLHWNDAGLPIGSQFVADRNREDKLFSLAAQLEAHHPWHDRVPPVNAFD